jgi:hypothetical protein
MSQLDFIKYLMQNKKAQGGLGQGGRTDYNTAFDIQNRGIAAQNRIESGGLKHNIGGAAQTAFPGVHMTPEDASRMVTSRGPGINSSVQRPVAPAVAPNAPAATQQAQASVGAAPAPTPMRVPANRAATPSLRDNPGNLRGVNDVDPKVDHWKAFRQKAAQTLLTPGYHDKERGIWVNPATAVYEKEQKQAQTNKTRDFLVRKGYSLEDADAIVAGGSDAIKTAMTQVKAPKSFDKRGFEVVFKGNKAYGKNPNSGELTPAQFRQEESSSVAKETKKYDQKILLGTQDKILDNLEEQSQDIAGGALIGTGSFLGERLASFFPETDAAQVQAWTSQINAVKTLDSLQMLRESSGNGSSGLGQVTEKELRILEQLRGNLTTTQNVEEFKASLTELRDRTAWLANDPNISDEYLRQNPNAFEQWRARNGRAATGSVHRNSSGGGSVDSGWSVKEM